MDDLDEIDAHVRALEAQLTQAKELREAEARKRRLADDLQRQIDELEAQLSNSSSPRGYGDDESAVGAKVPASCLQSNASFSFLINDKPPAQPTRAQSAGSTPLEQQQERELVAAGTARSPTKSPTRWTPSSSPASSQQQQPPTRKFTPPPKTPPRQPAASAAPVVRSPPEIRSSNSSTPVVVPPPAPVVGASELTKRNHQWSKPDWALPSAALPDDDIQKESINNPLLKSPTKTNAYERKVRPKELELMPGTFVAPTHTPLPPDPRLVWIVVNVDGCKLGKIVMHLAGTNIDPIVDVFGDLKGLELQRSNQSRQLVVPDIDPVFTIVAGNSGPGCFGIIQEGRDIFDQCLAAPTAAILTIKQSHIYPVKKAKPIVI
jgi:hypothetical protein